MLVGCVNKTTTWMDLKDIKEAVPIKLAEFAVANRIDDEPVFAWWVPYTPRKRNMIISKVKKKYWKTTSKHGVQLPKNAAQALKLDEESGNDFWEKTINKETKRANIAYVVVEGCTPEEVW